MSTLLHRSAVKGIREAGQTLASAKPGGFSLRRVWARRAFLNLYDDAIECGDWRIPFLEIQQAELLSLPYFFTQAYCLRVQTGSALYQFTVSPSRFWKGDIPFAANRSRYSGPTVIFAQVLRIATLVCLQTFPPVGVPYLLYVIWLHFRK
jgi:hypothetical protein